MREHGVLKRVLLVYGEGIRRLEANEDLPPDAIADAAKIIRNFIEDYHEKLEENFLFPRFEKKGVLVGSGHGVARTTPGWSSGYRYDKRTCHPSGAQERRGPQKVGPLSERVYSHV
jgi:hypothetical protein